MRAGDLRHLVTLEEQVQGTDPYGNPTTVWEDRGQVWAAVEPLRGRQLFEAQTAFGEIVTKVRIRYRSGITPSWRVLWDGRVLAVKAALDVDGRHRELELMCVEVAQ